MPAIHPNTPPQKPNHQPVSQFVPQFKTKPCTSTYMPPTSQLYFPLSLDSYRAVVLAFSLYKLVSDRRIWTPIKPRFDEGIKELR